MTNVMTEITSRSRILAYLRNHNGSSAAEISRALHVSSANIRYHLGILTADGRVQVLGMREGQARGRPVQIYGLNEWIAGDFLPALADALLEKIFENISDVEAVLILQSLASRLVPAGDPGGLGVHITRRLAQLIVRLNGMGYSARWEAHAAAPRIIFEHCPYARIIERHPEVCKMDIFILKQNLSMQVEQITRREKTNRGTYFCQFVLRP